MDASPVLPLRFTFEDLDAFCAELTLRAASLRLKAVDAYPDRCGDRLRLVATATDNNLLLRLELTVGALNDDSTTLNPIQREALAQHLRALKSRLDGAGLQLKR